MGGGDDRDHRAVAHPRRIGGSRVSAGRRTPDRTCLPQFRRTGLSAGQSLARSLPGTGSDGYSCFMTKLLEQALEAVTRLPPEPQNEIARAMLALAAHEGGPAAIDPAHLPDVLESLAQAKRRPFATEAVEAAFRPFDQ